MSKQKIIDFLNTARSMELQVISQYMTQHYVLDSMENKSEEASYMKLIAIDEMRHAERFAERIRELGGIPTTERIGPIKQQKNPTDMYNLDVNHEENTINHYKRFEKELRNDGDIQTADLFKEVLEEEQLHLEHFKNYE